MWRITSMLSHIQIFCLFAIFFFQPSKIKEWNLSLFSFSQEKKKHWRGGGVTTNLDCLDYVNEELQYPGIGVVLKPRVVSFPVSLIVKILLNTELKLNKHSNLDDVICRFCEDWMESSKDDIFWLSIGSECCLVRVLPRCCSWCVTEPVFQRFCQNWGEHHGAFIIQSWLYRLFRYRYSCDHLETNGDTPIIVVF